MTKIFYVMLSALFLFANFSTAVSNDSSITNATLINKCETNLKFIKMLKDQGVIRDRSYISIFEHLDSSKTKPLSDARRKNKVNSENFDKRIAEIEREKKNNPRICIFFSAGLIRNLSDYADFATKSEEGEGLNKFQPKWQSKVYILGDEATLPPTPAQSR